MCIQEQVTFPVTLGVNAFRGFLNEFMQQQSKRKGSKQKNAKTKVVRESFVGVVRSVILVRLVIFRLCFCFTNLHVCSVFSCREMLISVQ